MDRCTNSASDPPGPADLPVSQLALSDESSDPRIADALRNVQRLDERLKEVALEAALAKREAHPELWAAQEKQRLEQHTQRVEEALR